MIETDIFNKVWAGSNTSDFKVPSNVLDIEAISVHSEDMTEDLCSSAQEFFCVLAVVGHSPTYD